MGTIPNADRTFSDGVCQIWVGFVKYGLLFTTVPSWNMSRIILEWVFFWSLSVLSIWAGHIPIFDKSQWQNSTEYFSKGDPLQLLKWWNRALWLAEKRSHGQFRGLSLVESTASVFPNPPRSKGVCHIWVGFVKSGILPIYDKPWWQIPHNNYSWRQLWRYRIVRGPYLTNTDKPQQPSVI